MSGTTYTPIHEGSGSGSGSGTSEEFNYVQLVGGLGVHEGNLFLNESLVCLDSQQGLEVAQVVCRSLSPHFDDLENPITFVTFRMLGFSRWKITAEKFLNIPSESEALHLNCDGTEMDVRSILLLPLNVQNHTSNSSPQTNVNS